MVSEVGSKEANLHSPPMNEQPHNHLRYLLVLPISVSHFLPLGSVSLLLDLSSLLLDELSDFI